MVRKEFPTRGEFDRGELFDPKPLKYYRPPLKSDSRNLFQKVAQLSINGRIEDAASERPAKTNPCQYNGKFRSSSQSGALSFSLRSHNRSLSTGLVVKEAGVKNSTSGKIVISNPRQLVIENGSIEHSSASANSLKSHTAAVYQQSQTSGASTNSLKSRTTSLSLQSQTSGASANSLKSRTTSVSLQSQTSGASANSLKSRTTSVSLQSQTKYTNASQNWRLSKHINASSCTEVIPQSLTSVTPKLSLLSEDVSTPLFSSKGSTRNEIHRALDKKHSNDSDCSKSDTSLDLNSTSVTDDEVLCLTPFDPVPSPILLLPVPDDIRRYTPIPQLDRTSSPDLSVAESSSGVSSASQRSELSSRCLSSASLRSEDFFSGCSQRSSSSCSMASLAKEVSEEAEVPHNGQSSRTDSSSRLEPCSETQPVKLRSRSMVEGCSVSDMSAMGLPTSFRKSHAVKRKYADTVRKDVDVEEAVETCFSKKFQFESKHWKLPDPAVIFNSDFWEVERFLKLKHMLNDVKDELNDMPLQDWHAHTRRRNKAGNIMWQLRNKVDPELPTQAWCKFYENASGFPLVPQEAINLGTLNSVHLCEAPGAFITSLNHYLFTNFGRDFKFNWRAVTLNPYYEGNPLSCMINDDRLLLQTLDKWLFGKDNTGDLMSYENLIDITKEASTMGKILLVTADGSIDCQDNPAEQEDLVSWLHFCETVAALQLLAPGGSFLIKMFTFYEHFSICLMYLLNCVFKTVAVNKPVTSKEGNSEVYVVCTDYVGASQIHPWLEVLMKSYGQCAPSKAMFPLEDIPSTFLDQLYACADFFRTLQTEVITENIRSFHNPYKKDGYVTAATRHKVSCQFFDRYKIAKLDQDLYLVDKRQLRSVATPNIDPRVEEGSFNDRCNRRKLSPLEELKFLKDDLNYMNVVWPGDFDVFWMDFPEHPEGFKITRGKAVTVVNSSKFCLGSLLKLRNRVREIAKEHFKLQVLKKTSKSDTREFPWPDDDSNETANRKVITLDFKNELWSSLEDGSNAVHEKNACRKVLSVIENKIFRDDCLELRGYPLLTQFNVGLVYLLGHLFEKVGFVRPKDQDIRVLFYRYRKFHPEMKQHWDEVCTVMDCDSDAVLSVVKISEISDGDFYKYITKINNLCVVEQIQDLLEAMSPS